MLFLVFVTSCKKEEVKAPSPPPPPSSSLTTAELALVGHWNLDLFQVYYADTVYSSQAYSDSITCMLDLQTSISTILTGYHDAISGISCAPAAMPWKENSGFLYLAYTSYYIESCTTSSLVLRYMGGSVYYKYYFHK